MPEAQLATADPSLLDNPGQILDGENGAVEVAQRHFRRMARAGMEPTVPHMSDVLS